MTTATTQPSEAHANGQAKATDIAVRKVTTMLSVYDKVGDPLDFVAKMGTAIAQSKMFGCNNLDQGRVLAMACLCERKNPLDIVRKYHIMGGKLTMRADAMLADFKGIGGSYRIVSRTPDKAAIELTLNKQKNLFEFAWSEAVAEDYVYTSDANKGAVKKLLPDGSVNPAALKDNWSTPRRRMQMLWARVVSDAVRAVAPEVNAGSYTPEELGGGTVVEMDAAAGQPAATAEHGEVVDAEFEVIEDTTIEPATEAAAEPPFDTNGAATALAESATDMMPYLVELKGLKDELLTDEQYKAVLDKNYGVRSARELNYEQLSKLLGNLRAVKAKQQVAAGTDEASQWANNALGN